MRNDSMAVSDILEQYIGRSADSAGDDASNDYGEVASTAPAEIVKDALAEAFRSQRTPPFPELAAVLFGRSDSEQRAGMLRLLLETLGPAAAGLERVPGGLPETPYRITGADAGKVQPELARDLAADGEKLDAGLVDRVAAFYARHPDVVKKLDNVALGVALSSIARRMRAGD